MPGTRKPRTNCGSATATAASPLIDSAVGYVASVVELVRGAYFTAQKPPPLQVEVVHPRNVTVLEDAAKRMLRH